MHLSNRTIQHIFCSVLLVFGLVLNARGQDSYTSLIRRGRELAYNADFSEAETLLAQAAHISPGEAESYFYVAQVHLWTYMGTNNPAEYKTFMMWSDSTISKLRKALDSDSKDYRATYLLGNTYLLRAMAGATAHSYLDAFWAIKSANSYFKKTLKLNPDFYDAYRGVGEIHYFLSFIPASVRWSIPLFGLEANKAKGFSELKLAYEKGTLDRLSAAYSLAQVYSNYVAEYDSAEALLRGLVDRFPRNPIFNYDLSVVFIKERRLHEAEKYLDTVLELNNPDFVVLNNLSLFLKGDIYFKLNDFAGAIKYNKKFLEKTKVPDYTGIANYRLAICYRALGNDSMMRKSLSDAMNGNQNIYDDVHAKDRSRLFLKTGISQNELMTLEMKNDIDAGLYEEAYSSLLPAVKRIHDSDTRAEALVALSDAAIHLGKYSDGIRFATMADSTDPDEKDWIEPRSWYWISLGNYHIGDFSTARVFLRKARDTHEYRANPLLNEMINNLEEKLKGE